MWMKAIPHQEVQIRDLMFRARRLQCLHHVRRPLLWVKIVDRKGVGVRIQDLPSSASLTAVLVGKLLVVVSLLLGIVALHVDVLAEFLLLGV